MWGIYILVWGKKDKWVPNKTEVYAIENMLDSPDSFIWSVFRLQPTETEQAGAGEEGRTLSTCKNNIHKSHFGPSDPS